MMVQGEVTPLVVTDQLVGLKREKKITRQTPFITHVRLKDDELIVRTLSVMNTLYVEYNTATYRETGRKHTSFGTLYSYKREAINHG